MFCVVEFLNDNSVQLVPTKWINATRDQCKWPPGPAASLIKNLRDFTETWIEYPIRILKSCGKLECIANK